MPGACARERRRAGAGMMAAPGRAWLALADAVLVVHVLFVLFVVLGLVLIVVGAARGWRWVRGRRFRVLHLAAIGIVAVQAWVGAVCPLTTLEAMARRQAGASGYEAGFIAHWLHALLYWQAPPWVFVAAYTAFGLLVAGCWFAVPPGPRGQRAP